MGLQGVKQCEKRRHGRDWLPSLARNMTSLSRSVPSCDPIAILRQPETLLVNWIGRMISSLHPRTWLRILRRHIPKWFVASWNWCVQRAGSLFKGKSQLQQPFGSHPRFNVLQVQGPTRPTATSHRDEVQIRRSKRPVQPRSPRQGTPNHGDGPLSPRQHLARQIEASLHRWEHTYKLGAYGAYRWKELLIRAAPDIEQVRREDALKARRARTFQNISYEQARSPVYVVEQPNRALHTPGTATRAAGPNHYMSPATQIVSPSDVSYEKRPSYVGSLHNKRPRPPPVPAPLSLPQDISFEQVEQEVTAWERLDNEARRAHALNIENIAQISITDSNTASQQSTPTVVCCGQQGMHRCCHKHLRTGSYEGVCDLCRNYLKLFSCCCLDCPKVLCFECRAQVRLVKGGIFTVPRVGHGM
ncbi:uncharacterized protein F5Z01DRAFT_25742 [Emericellopsis atlantica]|uniref:Uncharacterized protein n=1 Tax=Emericellopsis atlantica TaxID=2614577 RepID=A0A9P7ZX87_9HYPO|nr:uncharacterized protein F5Z01DRAFT_25742 [Emericellopsis atlantica]KAG9259112.1 hypothetical protein F5Z01DRAFT_25742 [Emericellopsis atlantica]